MIELINIIHYTELVITVITILLAIIYSIPILLIRRFQNFNNIFTTNLCLAIIFCNSYWIFYYVLLKFQPDCLAIEIICSILIYLEMMCTLEVPFAFLAISINRLCCIVYHTKIFFKRKQWIILCITIQWISGISFSLPRIPFDGTRCMTSLWMRIYIFLMIVIIPTLTGFIIHIIIFNHVRSSSQRVRPSLQVVGNDGNHLQQQGINRRDIRLVQRMIVMFIIFIGGWTPIYIYFIIIPDFFFTLHLSSFLILLAQLCLLFDIISLYVYNNELRQYLKNIIFKCFHIE